jgi:hypothetical protein
MFSSACNSYEDQARKIKRKYYVICEVLDQAFCHCIWCNCLSKGIVTAILEIASHIVLEVLIVRKKTQNKALKFYLDKLTAWQPILGAEVSFEY